MSLIWRSFDSFDLGIVNTFQQCLKSNCAEFQNVLWLQIPFCVNRDCSSSSLAWYRYRDMNLSWHCSSILDLLSIFHLQIMERQWSLYQLVGELLLTLLPATRSCIVRVFSLFISTSASLLMFDILSIYQVDRNPLWSLRRCMCHLYILNWKKFLSPMVTRLFHPSVVFLITHLPHILNRIGLSMQPCRTHLVTGNFQLVPRSLKLERSYCLITSWTVNSEDVACPFRWQSATTGSISPNQKFVIINGTHICWDIEISWLLL